VQLRAACDRAERTWRAGIPPDRRLSPLSNMAYLTSSRWYDDARVPAEILQ